LHEIDFMIPTFYLILLVTIPAILVFLTAWWVLKNFLEAEIRIKSLDLRQSEGRANIALKLQALERLLVLCDRIHIPSLVLRTQEPNMKADMLKMALLYTINEEMNHNVSQQLYVSSGLWKVIQSYRDNVSTFIDGVYQNLPPDSNAQLFAETLFIQLEKTGDLGTRLAIEAIKKESEKFF
jgi:hypothetical protein